MSGEWREWLVVYNSVFVPSSPNTVFRLFLFYFEYMVQFLVHIHRRGGEEGGILTCCVACLGRLTVDHASLSRRITVPTSDRDAFTIWVLNTLSPSCFAACGHHLSLSTAIGFSLLCSASNDFIPPSLTPRISPSSCVCMWGGG